MPRSSNSVPAPVLILSIFNRTFMGYLNPIYILFLINQINIFPGYLSNVSSETQTLACTSSSVWLVNTVLIQMKHLLDTLILQMYSDIPQELLGVLLTNGLYVTILDCSIFSENLAFTSDRNGLACHCKDRAVQTVLQEETKNKELKNAGNIPKLSGVMLRKNVEKKHGCENRICST